MGDVSDFTQCQQSVFDWIKTDKKNVQAHQTISSDKVAKEHGVPQAHLVKYIKTEIKEAEACQSLPFTLALVVSYSVMAITHNDAVTIRAVEDSLAFDVDDNSNFAYMGDNMGHKGVPDVNSAGDFWSWMNIGLMPLLFGQGDEFSEGSEDADGNWSSPSYAQVMVEQYDVEDRGWYMSYNRIVGGIRLLQERSEEAPCTPASPPSTDLLYGMGGMCVHGLDYNIYPESGLPQETAMNTKDPKRIRWLYVFEDYDILQEKVWEMEAGVGDEPAWLDKFTKKIEIGIPVFNAEFGVHTLLRVNFYFARGGHVWKRIIPMSVFAQWNHQFAYGFFDVIFCSCLLYIFGTEAWEVQSLTRKNGLLAIPLQYMNFWNAVDWFTVLFGFMFICVWLGTIGMIGSMNAYMGTMGDIGLASVADPGIRIAYAEAVEGYYAELQAAVSYVRVLRLCTAAYPLVIIFRLLKSFSAQPRLAMVTKTISKAGPDLFHFMIVFTSVFGTFMICGIVLFGREVESFNTVPKAFMACFRIMMGDIEWEALMEIGRLEAGIWLWLFIIFIVLLMLNMILAIIMDNYEEVKNESGYKETLVEEGQQAWKRWRGVRMGTIVPLEEVLDGIWAQDEHNVDHKALAAEKAKNFAKLFSGFFGPPASEKKLDEEVSDDETHGHSSEEAAIEETEEDQKIIMIDQLVKIVSSTCTSGSMKTEQAAEIIRGAVEDFYELNKEGAELEEVMAQAQKVNHRLKRMKHLANLAYRSRDPKPVTDLYTFGSSVSKYLADAEQERATNLKHLDQLRDLKKNLHERLMRYAPRKEDVVTEQPDPEPKEEKKEAPATKGRFVEMLTKQEEAIRRRKGTGASEYNELELTLEERIKLSQEELKEEDKEERHVWNKVEGKEAIKGAHLQEDFKIKEEKTDQETEAEGAVEKPKSKKKKKHEKNEH